MNTMIKVGSKRIVAMRYIMKNSTGEVLANIMEDKPVVFLHGSGEILPGLEGVLTGLKIGEHKSFSISPETAPELNGTFHFDIIIDDIRWATEKELKSANPGPDVDSENNCGEGCCC